MPKEATLVLPRRAHSRVLAILLIVAGSGPLSANAQKWAGPVPSSVTAQNGVLYLGGNRFTAPMTLAYAGGALEVNGMVLPADTTTEALPETVPKSSDKNHLAARGYLTLLAFRRHLDEGGLIVCLHGREILIPIGYSPLFDGALSKLLTGQERSTAEERQLRTRIPPDRWEEASRPLPLMAADARRH